LLADGEELLLQSRIEGPAQLMPKGWDGFDIVTRTHVEGHAAASMWQNGLQKGVLIINNPPCSNCNKLLPKMLPPNLSLRVIAPNKFNKLYVSLK
jgi:hypothetical protein